MYKVTITETAQKQIDDMVYYMISKFANVDIAIDLLSDIDETN